MRHHSAGTEIGFSVRSNDRAGIFTETVGPHPGQEFIRDSAVMRSEDARLNTGGGAAAIYCEGIQENYTATTSARNFSFKSAAIA